MVSQKTMFEIYRDGGYNRRYRAVYFSELNEHNKDYELNSALAGEHVYDGFIDGATLGQAKRTINQLLRRLNAGERLRRSDFEQELSPFAHA